MRISGMAMAMYLRLIKMPLITAFLLVLLDYMFRDQHEKASNVHTCKDSAFLKSNPEPDLQELPKLELLPLLDEYQKTNQKSSSVANNVLKNKKARKSKTILKRSLYSEKKYAIRGIKETVTKEIKLLGNAIVKNGSWSDLLIKHGGKPMLSLVFTTWRSGSTFLGEALSVHPAMFYFYEPLMHLNIVQVRDGDLATEAVRVLRHLMHCNYSKIPSFVNYYAKKNHAEQHSHNTNIWKYCSSNRKLCNDAEFLSAACKEFPLQSMKTVRMRLSLSEELVVDPGLNMKIVFLVRDPRGTLVSRKHRVWCPGQPDCDQPKRLCDDLVKDYHAAIKLRQKFPNKYLYEDLSSYPENGTRAVFKFYGLEYHANVREYLKKHTSKNLGGVSSTFRDSKATAFKWKHYFMENIKELNDIQTACEEAMNLWGYNLFTPGEDSWDTFHPTNDGPKLLAFRVKS